ncbi:MAG: putative DNA modification/repair radical SAM protein [Firmicutes bacterium CAG_194_44_15]|jgi:putative DNA modification/repair radical SAM protein|nr:MAG: putative DNA modification/repair radical SAM protein [Firmicutes bacterium CAG_194_44_15]
MIVLEDLEIEKKLEILSDAAKYDVACTSSGVERKGNREGMGNATHCGICHSFAADGRCISLLKVLMTNECIYDCKYCINRRSNDTVRTSFTPQELCGLTIQFYRRNYIEGLFLSSGIRRSPDETMEQIYRVLFLLRRQYHFNGYIHVKGIPGASAELVQAVGYLADRMSLNLELPTAQGLQKLAPGKTREKILTPMRQIQNGIREQKLLLTDGGRIAKKPDNGSSLYLPGDGQILREKSSYGVSTRSGKQERFVPAGQSTQMIVGATQENDYQILTIAESLYRKFELKRVFYSAYVALNEDKDLPQVGTKPPLLREHRLYQADFLLRFYGFAAKELLSEEKPNFNVYLDPKCDWAIRHLEYFPVEINRAGYEMLLRVPGIGVKSAQRIMRARRSAKLDFDQLKRIGVVLKRAHYFITCNGKMLYHTKIEEDYITRRILELDHAKNWQMDYQMTYRQLSLFDDRKEGLTG